MPLPLLPLGISAAGSLISGLLGRGQDRAERKRRAELMRLASPDHLRMLQNQLYSQYLSGPAFSQARRGAFNASTNMQNRLQSGLAARGLSTSGIGTIAPSLAGSSLANILGQLRTNAYGQSGSQAAGLQAQQLATLGGLGPSSNYAGQAVAGGLGDLASLLAQLYGKK
jgi:hypothetical protein